MDERNPDGNVPSPAPPPPPPPTLAEPKHQRTSQKSCLKVWTSVTDYGEAEIWFARFLSPKQKEPKILLFLSLMHTQLCLGVLPITTVYSQGIHLYFSSLSALLLTVTISLVPAYLLTATISLVSVLLLTVTISLVSALLLIVTISLVYLPYCSS